MTDYNAMKVPELKKLLIDRSLQVSGNKADLIARLQENDSKPTGAARSAPAAADDEIDWDEDEAKATTEPAAAAIAAGGQGQIANPVAVPNQKVDVDPATTTDLKVTGGESIRVAADGVVASSGTTTAETAPALEAAPKPDFSIGIQQTDAEKEAEKRAARAKRFGITEDDEEMKKKQERAQKFGIDQKPVVKGLDDALPERRAKRGREGGDRQGGRNSKRQTPDRRTGPVPAKAAPATAAPAAKKASGRVIDDPSEKAKAEARAKRFATTT